ncbi:sensor histidine kinase [Streptomyces sp. 5.8]|uniref:sensor histidine kinase n=1 Tax=Streptomyces sp. 5.8 TaxID=3406571 RepID=UPI003BB75FD6
MKWALVRVCLAVTLMVVAAFAVPLALTVRDMARDRAFSAAERQSAAIGPVLSITTEREQLARALASTEAGAEGRMSVHVPGIAVADLGGTRVRPQDVDAAEQQGRMVRVEVSGGWAILQPTALGASRMAVVEVFVPARDLTRGVHTAWLVLAGVALALVAGSAVVADRLGIRMVRPAERLAEAAHALGEGRLDARVPEEGPTELRTAAQAFNLMAEQVISLLEAERELAADLSHRLRTPLTALRLNAASLGGGQPAEQTRAAVAKLESEVDTIIRTAREHRPCTGTGTGPVPGIGCDAAAVVRERLDFWAALAEDEGRPVRVAGTDEPAAVPVARADLAAALDVMLGNVFRHTPEGTGFSVDLHRGGDALIVLVSDAGPGIADPAAALRRGNEGGRPGSTGLGLDIVRKLAESTGGEVSIGRSVLGGAEVRVRIGHAPRPTRRRPRTRRGGRRSVARHTVSVAPR